MGRRCGRGVSHHHHELVINIGFSVVSELVSRLLSAVPHGNERYIRTFTG
jgi:hypothetical protein